MELQNPIGHLLDGNFTKEKKLTFLITVPEDVQKIALFIDGRPVGYSEKKISSDGKVTWICTLTDELTPNQQYKLTAKVTDQANNTETQDYPFFVTENLKISSIELDPESQTGSAGHMTSRLDPLFILHQITILNGQKTTK